MVLISSDGVEPNDWCKSDENAYRNGNRQPSRLKEVEVNLFTPPSSRN